MAHPRVRKKGIPNSMRCLQASLITHAIVVSLGHPDYVDVCGPPNHSGRQSSSSGGVAVSLSGSTLTLSASNFRGFMLTTDKQLKFSGLPARTTASGICGGSAGTWSHTSSSSRSSISATVSCSDYPGQQVHVSGYVVYSYESRYDVVAATVTCPGSGGVTTAVPSTSVATTRSAVTTGTTTDSANAVSDSTTTPSPVVTTAAPSTAAMSVLNDWVMMDWMPSNAGSVSAIAKARVSFASADSSMLTFTFDNAKESIGWMGVSFGESDYYMSGGKKTVIITLNSGACAIGFYTLHSNNVRLALGSDPFGVDASCTVDSVTGIATLQFTIGGFSTITLPAAGSTLYAIFAGGRGVGLGDHGPNWDYRRVDFASTSSSPVVETPIKSSSEYYLIHGILEILNFSLLMPISAFLVLSDKVKFLTLHKWLGLLIIVLWAVAWGLVSSEHDPRNFSDDSVGETHGGLGGVANGVAAAVLVLGVVLWWVRLPGTMKKWVRYAHGIVGVVIAFFGPYVVWTGWVRLAPVVPGISALDSSPIIWLLVSIVLGAVYLIVSLGKAKKAKLTPTTRFTHEEVTQMMVKGKKILLVDNKVVEVPAGFEHPGGNEVIQAYLGKEVGALMNGEGAVRFSDGTSRTVVHSGYAMRLVKEMQIGVLETAGGHFVNGSPPEITEDDSAVCKVSSVSRINHPSNDCPVLMFSIRLGPNIRSSVVLGSKVYISVITNGVAKPYTIFKVVGEKSSEDRFIQLAIKIYPNGQLTPSLAQLVPGSDVIVSDPVSASLVPGNPQRIIMLAGGTGVTPMYNYIVHCSRVPLGGFLLWWLRDATDLFLAKELEQLARSANVRIILFFTKPGSPQHLEALGAQTAHFPKRALSGHVSPATITTAIGSFEPAEITVVMSGPHAFAQAAKGAVKELGVPVTNVLSLD